MVFTNGKMVMFIAVNGPMVNKMAKAFINGRMERSMRVILLMMPEPENVRLLGKPAIIIQVILLMAFKKARAFLSGTMEQLMMGTGLMAIYMAMVLSNGRMVMFMRVSLPMA